MKTWKESLKNVAALVVVGVALAACCSKQAEVEESAPVNTIIPGSAEDFEKNVSNVIYYGFDRYDLTPEAKNVSAQIASWMKMYTDKNLVIEGHTDKRGTQDYNLALGSRRAESVKADLVANGVDASRLSTVSFGKEALVAQGDTEEDHALNRRAHIIVAQ